MLEKQSSKIGSKTYEPTNILLLEVKHMNLQVCDNTQSFQVTKVHLLYLLFPTFEKKNELIPVGGIKLIQLMFYSERIFLAY